MIPKVIHYCWFGGKSLPKSAIQCINSWKKFFPDYEIKEWNESNYDVHKIPYIHEAYESKKYAFVSDYARFDILYQYGGVYFDTDVKVLKSFDDIIARGSFMGREAGAWMSLYGMPRGLSVAPGLGFGAEVGMTLYKELLDVYHHLSFYNEDGTLNTKTIVSYTTEVLLKHGLTDHNEDVELVNGVWIYPADVFCPMDHTRGCKVAITENTHSIHLYDASWADKTSWHYKAHLVKNVLMRIFGPDRIQKIINYFK